MRGVGQDEEVPIEETQPATRVKIEENVKVEVEENVEVE